MTIKQLVLIGGGHSHLEVLREFALHPLAGVQLTLISRDLQAPYSGMLPGLIAGQFRFDETHIDLIKLTDEANARLIHAAAMGLDLSAQTVRLASGTDVAYDYLSINSGSIPQQNTQAVDAIAVKPVDQFLKRFEALMNTWMSRPEPLRIAVVGGGAGGVELALSMRHRLRVLQTPVDIMLLTDGTDILLGHNARVRRKFHRILQARGIRVLVNNAVVASRDGAITTRSGVHYATDATFWVTHASAPEWLRGSGLTATADGFIAINDFLQSSSNPRVFASGDVATSVTHPRPKSGVFAVRQGVVLAKNLRHALQGLPLQKFFPQRQYLSLISTGDQYAVASRGWWSAEGRWVWLWKEWIDRNFIGRYRYLPRRADGQKDTR